MDVVELLRTEVTISLFFFGALYCLFLLCCAMAFLDLLLFVLRKMARRNKVHFEEDDFNG